LESALPGSPATHAFPVLPALPWEDDVESVAEPFLGLSGASDVIAFSFLRHFGVALGMSCRVAKAAASFGAVVIRRPVSFN
jgi:hypothetical protein